MAKEFHENLKLVRENKEITQKAVAEAIGVAKSTYSLYESGKREPDIDKIKKISIFLKTSADYLLGLDVSDTALRPDEQSLLSDYNLLNDSGQHTARGYVKGLTASDEYRKESPAEPDELQKRA